MSGVSLLITVLTQMISSALALRGSNLRWGLVQLIIISGSALTRFTWLNNKRFLKRLTLASTVRVDELAGILGKLGDAAGDQTERAMHKIYTAAAATVSPEMKAPRDQVTALARTLRVLPAAPAVGAVAPPADVDKLLERVPAKV